MFNIKLYSSFVSVVFIASAKYAVFSSFGIVLQAPPASCSPRPSLALISRYDSFAISPGRYLSHVAAGRSNLRRARLLPEILRSRLRQPRRVAGICDVGIIIKGMGQVVHAMCL